MGSVKHALMQYSWSLWCGIWVVCVVLFWGIPTMIASYLVPVRRQLNHPTICWMMERLYNGLLWAAGVRLEVIGPCVALTSPAVWVANHQSALDIPVLGAMLHGRPHIWYALDTFCEHPVLGWFLGRCAVSIDQNNPMRAARSMLRAVARARTEGLSTVLFPEGGRYTDGMIHTFMPGFARIASKLDQPIVPVYCRGLAQLLPPHAWLLHSKPWRRTTVTVRCGGAMYRQEGESEEAFGMRVFAWFQQWDEKQG